MSTDPGSAARELATASQAYTRAEFGPAVQGFQAALDAGADSADVWFNLGDALYRAGQHGQAALAWERAVRRDPGDADARSNLQLLRSTSADAAIVGRESPLYEFGSRVDPDLPAAALLGTFTLACAILVFRRRVVGDAARALWAMGGLVLLVLALASGTAAWLSHGARDPRLAVVTADETTVRVAPHDGAATAFDLHGGTRLRIIRPAGAFDEVRLPSGLSGFLLARDIEPINKIR